MAAGAGGEAVSERPPIAAQPTYRDHPPRSATVAGVFARQRGMSLVEVMVAAFILAVGVLGVVAVIDRANAATSTNKAREGGTNVAREVIENASALPYREVTPTTLPERLRSRPGLADSDANAANGWTVVRRGREGDAGEIRYSIEASVCFLDDANDGTGAHDADFCAESPPAGSSDTTPKDYKRVDATVTWTDDVGRPATVRQTAIVTPRGAMDIPAVVSLTGFPPSPVTTSTARIDFSASTSSPADGVTFSQDGGDIGTATGGPTAWRFDWDISSLVDGDYVIGARARDDQGEFGAPMTVTYRLNRFVPMAPGNFVAGVNGTRVDTEWSANPERDIAGYRVYKQGASGGAVPVNCGTAATPVYLVERKTTCTDADPLATAGGSVSARSSSSAITGGTTLTVPRPQGVVAGDVLVATVGVMGPGQVSAPSGWTLIRSTGSSTVRQASFYRVVGSGEGTDDTLFSSTTAGMKGGMTAYTGVDASAPIDASNDLVGPSGDATAPSVTTTRAGAAIVVASTHRGDNGTDLSEPTGTIVRWVVERSNGGNLVAGFTQPTAGITPPKPIACSGKKNCDGWAAQTIALRPKSGVAVDYWVRAVDLDPSGKPRDGAESTRVNAYAPNTPPTAPTGLSGTLDADGSTRLDWTGAGTDPDPGDSVAFYRIYRDGVYYDRTNDGADVTWTDGDRGGVDHDYYLKAVDTHLAESPASATVRR